MGLLRVCPQLVPKQLLPGSGVRAGQWEEPAALPDGLGAAGMRGGGQERNAQNNSAVTTGPEGMGRCLWGPGVDSCSQNREMPLSRTQTVPNC